MSACTPFRDLLLEAEAAELRGEGGSPLAHHVRACRSCARAAALILEETSRLDLLLSEAPPLDVDALLARAGVVSGGAAAPVGTHRPAPGAPPRRRLSRRLWVPTAAAAALAALLLWQADEMQTPPASVTAAVAHGSPPLVEPAPGQDVAVMQTADPDITVVWLFPTG
ncbi:MAG: hypothetical protein Q8N53_10220 [Longimicrobiales bacterium]|nr:hypothetical protein [Longimicrobiales bacterium]